MQRSGRLNLKIIVQPFNFPRIYVNLTEEEHQILRERAQYFEQNARNAVVTTGSRV